MAVLKYRMGEQVFTLEIPVKKDQNTFHAINAAGNTVTANSSNSELNLLGENGISFKINPDTSTISIIGPSNSYIGKIAIENINNHNNDVTAHPFIVDSINNIKAITDTKTTNYTFNTKSEIDTWLLDVKNKEKLIKGDTFYIDSLEEHDYWWNGTEIKEIEAKVVDLTPEQTAALKGDQGISVSAISFDANGHLIITLYDPSTKTSNVVDVGAAETATLLNEINQAVTNVTASKTSAEQSAINAKNSEVAAKADADRAKTEADRAEGALVNNNLKLATIDKELSDYTKLMSQVNINQEAKQTVTGYDKILSLPKNAANGSAGFGLEGLTAQNLVKNGDFSQGTEGWHLNLAGATLSASNHELSVALTSPIEPAGAYQSIGVIIEHKYYVKAMFLPKYSRSIRIVTGGAVTQNLTPTANAWNNLSGINTAMRNGSLSVLHDMLEEYVAGESFKVKEVFAIDLTTIFGAGNEPDVATCDKMFANWFDGIKSVQSRGRVKSVGKNLCSAVNGSLENWTNTELSEVTISGDYFKSSNQTSGRTRLPLKLKKGKTYTLSATGYVPSVTSDARFVAILTNSVPIGPTQTVESKAISFKDLTVPTKRSVSFTPTKDFVDAWFYTIAASGDMYFKDIMVSESTDTIYEPYISTSKYLNSTESLRCVPNGVCDEIRQRSDGGYELVQRCKEYTLQASDIDSIAPGTNAAFARLSVPADCTTLVIDGNMVTIPSSSKVLFTDRDSTNNIGKHYVASTLRYIVALGTSTKQAQAALAGTKIVYQLATPIITPIETSGTLLSYPSGSVYWEPITADAGVYNNGLSILATGFPISSLETLSKVDFQTGIETALDISTAVIAPDGLSFTNPDLVNGDIVLFSYRFKDDAPEGNKTIDYYDSRYVVKDSVTGKFYQWGVSVANATPSFDLVEV